MAIAIRCPDCGKSYNLSDDQAGQRVRCRACGSHFDVTERVESLETVPTDGVTEGRRSLRSAVADAPMPEVRKKSRAWVVGLLMVLMMVFLVCAGSGWVVVLQTRKALAAARQQLLADLARAQEEAARARSDRDRSDQDRQKADADKKQAERLVAELNGQLALLRGGQGKGGELKIPDLAPIKDLDDALNRLKGKDTLARLQAMGWITKHSPYNGQQKMRVLNALRALKDDPDPAVAAGATQTELIVEQDL